MSRGLPRAQNLPSIASAMCWRGGGAEEEKVSLERGGHALVSPWEAAFSKLGSV